MSVELKLYYFSSCPFCKKVINFLEENNLKNMVILKNIKKDKKAREELSNIGGKVQVPCLFIDNQPLYESQDIIDYFKKTII